jgi:adenine-specific DNA-methyltransferase
MTQEPAKVDLESPDIAAANRAALTQLFPGVLTEGVLDAVRLAEALDVEVAEITHGRERFALQWAGKQGAVHSLLSPSDGALVPSLERSVNFDQAHDVFIEGDNLEVLKLLQKAYNDKVRMIYIDPPYNTGNDFVYKDDFKDGLAAYLQYTGQVDEFGMRTVANIETSGRRHSSWLSMMYPRLALARNLLTQDGVIFVSIDDNEVATLRLLLDEVFGPENFVATFVWEKRTNRENRKVVSYRHDTIICYARNIQQLPMNARALGNYGNPDNDPRGPWKSDPATAQAGHATASQFYDLTAPSGKTHQLPSGRCWIYTQEVMDQAIRDGRLWFGKGGNGVPRIKTYLNAKDRGLTPETILFAADAGTNEGAKNHLKSLFDGVAVFDTPKPVELIELLIRIGATPDSLIVDFFAGSGTTAEAVQRLNAEDGGRRRAIQVQLPEPLPDDAVARSIGLATVSDIAIERWARASHALGSPVDMGLRVFTLQPSSFAVSGDEAGALALVESTLVQSSPDMQAVAAEVFAKEGVPLDAQWRRSLTAGVDVISAEDVTVVLTRSISDNVVDEVLGLRPKKLVFLEDGFAGADAVKANAFSRAKSLGVMMKTV